jgi:molybdopterin converting factor small subunit
MTVKVELFGQLCFQLEKNQELDLNEALTVSELASLVGLKSEQIGMAVIDGMQVTLDTVVPGSCKLSLFPPMTGG